MKQTFYSNGKLLITGEYLVLDGAKAFALPTKFGQNLIIEKGSNQETSYFHKIISSVKVNPKPSYFAFPLDKTNTNTPTFADRDSTIPHTKPIVKGVQYLWI